jgi:N utilization substance protein B
MKPRRLARILAMQALFEIDAVHHDPERTIMYRFEDVQAAPDVQQYARGLMWGVLNHQRELDDFIRRHASAWPLEEVALLDRNLLRLGIYELLYADDTPPRVVINEAVELAKRFGNESTRRFVNGVLGAVMSELEASGRLPKGGRARARARISP